MPDSPTRVVTWLFQRIFPCNFFSPSGWPQASTCSNLHISFPRLSCSLPGICFLDKSCECVRWFIALSLTWHLGRRHPYSPSDHVSHGPDFIARQSRFSDKSSSKHAEEKGFSVCYIKRSTFKDGNSRVLKHLVSPPTLWPWQSWDIKSFLTNDDRLGQEPNPPPHSLQWPCCELLLGCQ